MTFTLFIFASGAFCLFTSLTVSTANGGTPGNEDHQGDTTTASTSYLNIINAPSGTFQGSFLTSFSGQQYAAYRGIPYALPPLGSLRFAKPQPHPVIKGVFDASRAAPVCLQAIGVDIGNPGQEDCLYLNVFTPLNNEQPKPSTWKVLVYIHGGAFFIGSGNEFVPGDLVVQGNMIVVTLNYRLSWLGFLKGNTTLLPGNQGMWDQLMALNWVKNNIGAFGGDSDDITLSGNSMGGESVSVWSIVKQGKDLFTKGLVMSGAIVSCPSTPGSSDILLDLLLERVGCWPDQTDANDQGSSLTFSPATMERVVNCLRELPSEKFVLPAEGSLTNKFTTIDGELFPASIPDLLEDAEYLKEVGFFSKDFIVSFVNHEGAPFSNGVFTSEMGTNTMDEFLSKKMRIPLPLVSRVHQWYVDSGVEVVDLLDDMWADIIMIVPPFKFLQKHTQDLGDSGTGPDRGRSYLLWFDHYPEFMPNPTTDGMFHEMEQAYMFDMTPNFVLSSFYEKTTDKEFTEEDWGLRKKFINVVTDFMRHGKPDVQLFEGSSEQWPPYENEKQFYINFGPGMAVEQFLLHERRHFWAEIFPNWLNEMKKPERKDEL